ncbi:MAG: hypothetical protein IKL86_05780 [Clostridia bacterium]|nr:hypothetical protein [Clostridia bacterium]
MIKCPYCKVSIATRTDVCPLCHKNLIEAGVSKDEIKKTPLDFPKKGKVPALSGTLFDKVYLLCALNVVLVSLAVELIVFEHIKVSWLILSIIAYFYLFLRVTIRKANLFPQKVLFQALILSVVVICTRRILPEPDAIFEYILPVIYLISMIIMGIFFIVNYKKPSRYLLNLITIAALGFLPFCVDLIEDVHAHPMSIITASLGAAILITLFAFYAKTIVSELKRNFHV